MIQNVCFYYSEFFCLSGEQLRSKTLPGNFYRNMTELKYFLLFFCFFQLSAPELSADVCTSHRLFSLVALNKISRKSGNLYSQIRILDPGNVISFVTVFGCRCVCVSTWKRLVFIVKRKRKERIFFFFLKENKDLWINAALLWTNMGVTRTNGLSANSKLRN